MLHPESEIQWMDVDKQEVETDGLAKFFGRYIDRGVTIDTTIVSEFNSENNVVKVPDWKGWSDLRRLKRDTGIKDWIRLTTKLGKTIIGTPETFIPVYNPEKMESGFHGETRYHTEIKTFQEIRELMHNNSGQDVPEITVRVRHAVDPEIDNTVDFDIITASEILELGPTTGYDIVTRSGFYNCNDIYLWNSLSGERHGLCIENQQCPAVTDPSKCSGCRKNW